MSAAFTCVGKQILANGFHYADAADETAAEHIVSKLGAVWQPIETAPRDGTHILAVVGETIPDLLDVRVVQFITGDDALKVGYREYARFGGWFIWNSADDFFMLDVIEPTHWMPLPDAPEASA